MRVLVVEDERLLADTVAEGLRRQSMAVDVCYDGDAALERVGVHGYDVIVLDRDLPGVHGDDVCQAVLAAGGGGKGIRLPAGRGLTNAVRVAVMTLRRKLGDPQVIETVPGAGYRIVAS